ncbi:putative inner membrane protein [Desulfamplus magnetovallimortis]|uniref:Putative inner membrane protein n=1 Tax=Desulfamplus magnetovallimortis TaxID=1246637 RepID=A0A1W1H7X1_9BACT|nr:BrnT family toxin [Desulfamplus magnetovallimortis]SLM28534.1 putative inner membrane protein [Desulfamplus magnetovallimortis]
MRFEYDKTKSERLRNDSRRRIGFEEAQELFYNTFIEDQHTDYPNQWRAIGWVKNQLYTVVYEEREDEHGEYYHLVTLWKATQKERSYYEKYTK